MRVTRVYTGPDNQSHFEELDIPLEPSRYGELSALVEGEGVIFRETPADGLLDFHPAPRRQFVVMLSGMVQIEVGDGSSRRLGPGDILLAEDTTGQGHVSREVGGPRRSLFIPIRGEFDLDAWRRNG